MTNQEAIELLNQEEVPMMLNGKNNEHLAVAHIKAIEALEKQVPKKPSYIDEDANYFECPTCGGAIYSSDRLSTHKYCLECGQAIDWRIEIDWSIEEVGYIEKAFTLYMQGLDGEDTANLVKEIKEKMTEEERKEFEEIVTFHQLVMGAM